MAINESLKMKVDEIAEMLNKRGIPFVFSVTSKKQNEYKRPGVHGITIMSGDGIEILNMITNQIIEYSRGTEMPIETVVKLINQELNNLRGGLA